VADEPDWLQPSRLELLADNAGIGPDELRDWLRAEVVRRRPEASGVFRERGRTIDGPPLRMADSARPTVL
jgi:hypothetical protein